MHIFTLLEVSRFPFNSQLEPSLAIATSLFSVLPSSLSSSWSSRDLDSSSVLFSTEMSWSALWVVSVSGKASPCWDSKSSWAGTKCLSQVKLVLGWNNFAHYHQDYRWSSKMIMKKENLKAAPVTMAERRREPAQSPKSQNVPRSS